MMLCVDFGGSSPFTNLASKFGTSKIRLAGRRWGHSGSVINVVISVQWDSSPSVPVDFTHRFVYVIKERTPFSPLKLSPKWPRTRILTFSAPSTVINVKQQTSSTIDRPNGLNPTALLLSVIGTIMPSLLWKFHTILLPSFWFAMWQQRHARTWRKGKPRANRQAHHTPWTSQQMPQLWLGWDNTKDNDKGGKAWEYLEELTIIYWSRQPYRRHSFPVNQSVKFSVFYCFPPP